MQLYPDALFHIYNQGNNKETIFFNRNNYLYFISKIRKLKTSSIDILAYCLMPNHFHLLIYTNPDFNHLVFSKVLRIALSSYTQSINKQENRSGSLFRQNTKSKSLADSKINYPLNCFLYIHQNPSIAGLVKKIEDWEFSSFPDYIGQRDGKICNKILALELLNLPTNTEDFYKISSEILD